MLGEEEAPTAGTTGRRWIIDPIDGTKAFTCGVPLYSNLLALEDEHGIAVGVVHLPALGETVWAGRGLGLLVRARPGPGAATHATPRRRLRDVELVHPLAARTRSPRVEAAGAVLRTWGDGYGYALVATGRVAAMVDPIVEPYDVGPDAGAPRRGRAAGSPTWPATRPSRAAAALGTNGLVHDELLALLRPDERSSRVRAVVAVVGERVEQVGPGPGHPRADRADRAPRTPRPPRRRTAPPPA